MQKYEYYDVVNDEGIASSQHHHYKNLKMIFQNKENAEDVLRNNPLVGLKIVPVILYTE